MEDRRQQRQNGAAGGNAIGGRDGTGDQTNQRRQPPTNEQRLDAMKQRLDDSTPEARSARDQFAKDMQSRRAELGLPPAQGGFGRGPR
jgi:hypothetical protein